MSVRLWGIALAPNKAYKLTVPEDVELQINQACLGPESTVRCFFFFFPSANRRADRAVSRSRSRAALLGLLRTAAAPLPLKPRRPSSRCRITAQRC
jgi:hypothetical protein